ncbi:MAG TPA: hypothetical protein VF801_06665 [Rhodocyclaceae bacterium]
MTCRFHVRSHPLGVVVFGEPGQLGELLIPGEECCGIGVAELERIARGSGVVTVPDAAADRCSPVLQRCLTR